MVKFDFSDLSQFDDLIDLRFDYAFKMFFTLGDKILLISLLNAIFANKGIARKIENFKIITPNLEKMSDDDKYSVIDIVAELDNGETVLIEMHMYELLNIKAKTIRSWAKSYAEKLLAGQDYVIQPAVIAITFTDGQVQSLPTSSSAPQLHRLCKIADVETGEVFSNAMELHFIDMKLFLAAINHSKKGGKKMQNNQQMIEENRILLENANPNLVRWLSLLTQKGIANKRTLEDICKDDDTMQMAFAYLVWHSQDAATRKAYTDLREKEDHERAEKLRMQKEIEDERRKSEQIELEKDKIAKEFALFRQKVAEQGITL
ncbi:MAG: Rpn family recombination-promoting nuclease/putative transposase [Firmicutes bacterium]|nr:Rpn family recombination-promoting nuclease/putative transposase [Bacillota bacterium]